jgi:hypothetical protein
MPDKSISGLTYILLLDSLREAFECRKPGFHRSEYLCAARPDVRIPEIHEFFDFRQDFFCIDPLILAITPESLVSFMMLILYFIRRV